MAARMTMTTAVVRRSMASARRRTTAAVVRAAVLVALAAGLVVGAPTTSSARSVGARAVVAPPGATVEVSPNADLVDFQAVHVTGTGFDGETLLEIFQCRGGAVSERDCDGYNAFFADVGEGGRVDETFYVDARIWLPSGVPVDCRTAPEGCEIGVGFLGDADEWPEAALHFDPNAPLRPVVSATVTPSAGLQDGQVVQVHGEHLSPREEGFAYLCGPGSGIPGTRCDLDRAVRGVPGPDGTLDLELAVQSRFTTPFEDEVDCTTASGGCEVVVAWGFTGPPDRTTAVPVSFGSSEPTTTTTMRPTTTTRPSTTTTTMRPSTSTTRPMPRPPATAAKPIRKAARFTG
jgi:hypothetical protein